MSDSSLRGEAGAGGSPTPWGEGPAECGGGGDCRCLVPLPSRECCRRAVVEDGCRGGGEGVPCRLPSCGKSGRRGAAGRWLEGSSMLARARAAMEFMSCVWGGAGAGLGKGAKYCSPPQTAYCPVLPATPNRSPQMTGVGCCTVCLRGGAVPHCSSAQCHQRGP